MSVFHLKVNIVTDNQTIIDIVKAKIKNRTDAKLWQDDIEWVKETGVNSNGHLYLRGEVRYLNEADMNVTLDWLKSKAALYKSELSGPEGFAEGSYIVAHECIHKKIHENTNVAGEKCSPPGFEWYK
ncbi:hypothetical protein KAR91_52685 [Candidatus Pacearchaeota archaeon]|nr:hypothetical protein [Candidatus Pacearchaeota archaeon]